MIWKSITASIKAKTLIQNKLLSLKLKKQQQQGLIHKNSNTRFVEECWSLFSCTNEQKKYLHGYGN
jgi:hypothetical protein